MGRALVLLGIWFGGFVLGFLAYLAYPALAELILRLLPFLLSLNSKVIGALVTGLVSSFITLLAVTVWAYSTRSDEHTYTVA